MRLGLLQGLSTGGFVPLGPTAVSNSKSLAFDGSDQHLTTTTDSTLATKTYSFWAQSSKTGQQAVFSHGGDNRGTFAFNWSASRPLLYLGDNYRFFDAISQQSDGNWHHWLVYLPAPGGSSDITASKLYCDGSEVSVNSTVSGGSDRSYTSGIQIGYTSSKFFSGHLDEFAIFDGDKTGIVADLYNSGVPTNLASTAGLEHWWRMGDATEPDSDGTNDLIFDQADKTLGSELLTSFTNGSTYPFDTFASSGTSLTSAIETSGNWGGAASNSFSVTSGEVYKVTFNLTYNSGSDTLRVVFADNANGAATQRSAPYYTNTNGVNTVYFKASATDSTVHLQLGTWHSTDVINFSASDISVKKVNGATATMTNMATSDIVQYTPNSYILSDLGITPDLAVSMTRKLVSDYSGSFYATSGSDVTTIYDQSGNSRNLTNGTTATATLSGSGNSARAVFSSSANTVLSSGTAGGSYAAGNHDVFIVFDPVGTDQQVIFGEGTASANLIAMDNGAFSAAIAGITLGEIRVNDAILPATVNRNALWDKMTVSGTMGGLNVLSFEDVDLSSIDGNVSLGADHNTWRLEGYFAEFIITPALTDAEHSAIVENIRAHYDAP